MHALATCVNYRGLHAVHNLVLLPAACQSQRVNDETVKDLNLLFFCIFHLEMRGNFLKTAFFAFGLSNAFT